jgi:hypothetical protein
MTVGRLGRVEEADDFDPHRHQYFIERYRDEDEESLTALSARAQTLTAEAQVALRQILAERGIDAGDAPQPAVSRDDQARMSSDLLNGPISKQARVAALAPAFGFANALLGPTGLEVGALWLVLAAVLAYCACRALVSERVRAICREADVPLEDKADRIRHLRMLLILSIVPAAILGALLAVPLKAAG